MTRHEIIEASLIPSLDKRAHPYCQPCWDGENAVTPDGKRIRLDVETQRKMYDMIEDRMFKDGDGEYIGLPCSRRKPRRSLAGCGPDGSPDLGTRAGRRLQAELDGFEYV